MMVSENKILRRIFRPNREEVTNLRKLHNEALQSFYPLFSIIRVTKIKYCDVHAVGQQSTVETLVYNRC
jgi:hypothetical protein